MIHKTILYIAIEKENVEIVKILLLNDEIDVNFLNIFYYKYTKFIIIDIYDVNYCFILIIFYFKYLNTI